MYTPTIGGGDIPMLPRDLLRESLKDLQAREIATQFVAAVDLKQRETLDLMWTGFRVAYARQFVFAAAGLFTLADQLEALVDPDKYYQIRYARIGMAKLCADCGEPDYPLDDKTGLCYTCWTLAGQVSNNEEE